MIDAATLIEDIERCFQLTASDVTPLMIQRHIDRLKQDGAAITANTKPTKALKNLIARNLKNFIDPKTRQAIENTELYVVPLPFCFAYSKPDSMIVIGNGLINLMAACGYWGNFIESLPAEFDDFTPLSLFPNMSALSALNVLLFLLIYRHYEYGEPLPDYRCLVREDQQAKTDELVKFALAGALSFVVLHEYGHLALNHHDAQGSVIPIDVPWVVDQDFSAYQMMELEADHFALQAIHPEYRGVHDAWIGMALNFHLQRETILSERTDRHPVNLNRLMYANTKSEGQFMEPVTYVEHLKKMGRSFESIEAKHRVLNAKQRKRIANILDRKVIFEQLSLLAKHEKLADLGLDQLLKDGHEAEDWTTRFSI